MTLPAPVPLGCPNVSHDALDTGLHAHPAPQLTDTLADPPFGPNCFDTAGESVKVQAPAAWVTVNALPATVSAAVREKGKETDGVFVLQGEKVAFKPVKTGIMGETEIEVLNGLNEGQEIVTGSYKTLRTLKDQAKVKTEKGKGKTS